MTKTEYNKDVWAYYLNLENDFCNTLNYVEFSEDNYNTYSKEFAKQLLSICSEIDVVFKILCELIAPDEKRNNICDYAKILCDFDGLTSSQVIYSYTKSTYSPFKDWTVDNSPTWWRDYNALKHRRNDSDNFKNGNLKNVFDSLAALYILNRYLCKKISEGTVVKDPETQSNLFNMVGWNIFIPVGNGFYNMLRTHGGISLIHE